MPADRPAPLAAESDAPAEWGSATWPAGAHHDPAAGVTTFAVAAPAADRVLLEIYPTATGADAERAVDAARGPDGLWRARLTGAGPGTLYGYRVWGPGWAVDPGWARGGSAAGFVSDLADDGVRFNPNKVLTDPYAREISHSPASPLVVEQGLDGGVFGTGGDDYRGRPRREHDTGRVAPKAVVVADHTSTGDRPRLPPEDAAIYEAHVRSLTAHPSAATLRTQLAGLPGFERVADVPDHLRGTYAGAAYLAPYLAALGFTTIELLPVHETTGSEPGLTAGVNFWGYATLGYFAPNRCYAADPAPGGPTREFKQMVAAFHAAGIEVYLDVVYNHTGEGGQWGGDRDTVGLTGLTGFAAPDYYVLTDDGRLVDGATGCGNQTDASSPLFQRLVLDSLAYWTDEMGVDGFRFDLAPVLGRRPDDHPREDWAAQRGFVPDHPLLLAIRDLAADRAIEVVAEAWDLWGYEVGNFPPGWAEWNGRYRDGLRRFLKGDGNTGELCAMVNGDFDHFADQGGPQRSINFLTAHDGFTLMDLVSFTVKDNDQPWPFGPSDGGSDNNLSWDSGGDRTLRRQRLRNAWTLLLLSRGVPLVVAGDEWGRTQNGNNNPYNLNTIAMWDNWAMAASTAPTAVPVDPARPELRYRDVFGPADAPAGANPLLVFAGFLARFRRDHPGLRQRRYGDAELGGDDVSYLFDAPDGGRGPAEGDRTVRLRIDAAAVGGVDLLVCVNMADHVVGFAVPEPAPGRDWRRIVDTAAIFEPAGNCWPAATGAVIVGDYRAAPWSVVVLAEQPGARSAGPPSPGWLAAALTRIAGPLLRWWRRRS